jgi:peptide/nickel transport system substrate-binding protein
MRSSDESRKKKLAEAIQTEAFTNATHAPLGEYVQPVAVRSNISGLIMAGLANIYWNVKKN